MPWDDDRVDQVIGSLLRYGVIVSCAVVLAGAIWYLTQSGTAVPNYHTFRGEPGNLRSVSAIIVGAVDGQSRCLIQLGLLLLIATPILRVAFSVFAFAMQRDRLYVAITLLVLMILLSSLTGLIHPPG
jgi:uncharacterized membrane protein